MLKTYVLLYNLQVGMRDDVKAYLNSIPEIKQWRTELPFSFFLLSEASASELAALFRQRTADKGRFIIAEIPQGNRQGWLSKDTWRFLKPNEEKPAE